MNENIKQNQNVAVEGEVKQVRPLARITAREISAEEIEKISGGGLPASGFCHETIMDTDKQN